MMKRKSYVLRLELQKWQTKMQEFSNMKSSLKKIVVVLKNKGQKFK